MDKALLSALLATTVTLGGMAATPCVAQRFEGRLPGPAL
ncbi:hypothetical protein FHT02_004156 [Sphingomonas xinjiangensis]|uniref:Uncharacterized protein n=1 Tax=Sphingomonas xinjiangensis TaxID=643568 RepID=A0A840YT87_9SPHN|nr:hypothetical protein [Sphingomonas xinjiangensis]